MASITSLGVHTPVSLQYLIDEGILPKDPKVDQYQRQIYNWKNSPDGEEIEEEILSTKDAVVWSQAKFIRNVYRFHEEGEDVVHTLMTRFPTPGSHKQHINELDRASTIKGNVGPLGLSSVQVESDKKPEPRPNGQPLSKALVVILKTKVHVYFLPGPNHILDLPFEVEIALPAPQGFVLQRKRTPTLQNSPSSQQPRAPPNSFFISQSQPTSSFLHSPSLAKSLARSIDPVAKPLHGDARLDSLFRDIVGGAERAGDDDVAPLYSLTDPLGDFGVVTYSLQHYKSKSSVKHRSGLNVDFEGLDQNEEVIYISPKHELQSTSASGPERLVLLVTLNRGIETVTVWHAWYLEEKSLKELIKLRAEHKAEKSRRRSSFLSANIGTGSATPAVRHRDGARESFAAPGTLRLPGEPTASQLVNANSRKPTREEEAEAMASQMDPDYQRVGSQQPARENRRISSMNADVRIGHGNVNASFAGPSGRRHTSFGAPNERRSVGHRRSRGSTPGSILSRSVGIDDDPMDLDTTIDYDDDETIDNIVRHVRATFDVCGIDSVFGSVEDGFKNEIIVRKMYSFSVGPSSWSQSSTSPKVDNYKVVISSASQVPRSADESRLNLYLHRRDNNSLRCLNMQILNRPLWPEMKESPKLPIPIVISDTKLGECDDLLKLKDGSAEAVLLGGRGLVFCLENKILCPLPAPQPYRVYDPADVLIFHNNLDKGVSKDETTQPVDGPKKLGLVGVRGSFDEITVDGLHHRRRLQLRPHESQIEKMLTVFEIGLSPPHSTAARRNWCKAHAILNEQPGRLDSTASNAEAVALVSAMFISVGGLIDSKARAALSTYKVASTRPFHSQTRSNKQHLPGVQETVLRDPLLLIAAALADEITEPDKVESVRGSVEEATNIAVKLMLGFHIIREEDKLHTRSPTSNAHMILTPMIAQLGDLLDLPGWSYTNDSYYSFEGASESQWSYVKSRPPRAPHVDLAQEPIGVFQWFEQVLLQRTSDPYPTLAIVAQLDAGDEISSTYSQFASQKTPRIKLIQDLLNATEILSTSAAETVEKMGELGMSVEVLDTLPESFAAPFKEAIARCESSPPSTWSEKLLQLVGRDDLVMLINHDMRKSSSNHAVVQSMPRDILSICESLDRPNPAIKTKMASRNAVSHLIFNKDRRLVEATSLMYFNGVQIAECVKLPEWTEAQHFEQQRRVVFYATIRMIALPTGDGLLHFDSQTPLLTEKYAQPGFHTIVQIQPMRHSLTVDRSGLTEEKVGWAYFHAGVSVGIRISRNAKNIDTSWIAFNKPNELTNRYAGLLLGLGLNGHLRHVAKWLSFKYLTPKHTMTSVGLLLGLSASYLGSMDGLITRMLSVHITRMLPPGAAELNVSATTQTAGLMGIGLLYHNTQHRRMSEVMLSEIEHMEVEDPDGGPDPLRDESYRLSAGFALGLINIGQGDNLRGLHGMQLPERLLAIAVGPRPVQAVHVFDRATAGAVVAIALVYMKTGNIAIASKIDIPDTEAQFDQVRPDVLLLRAMARHIIMWDDIKAKESGPDMQGWINDNLPRCYKGRWRQVMESQTNRRTIDSAHVPLFNVYTGLAWALSMKYAGSGNTDARDDILRLFDFFHGISEGSDAYYYDGKLGRSALRRCMDVLALSAATVMAGTGDIPTYRYLRRMHGRTDGDSTYGSHLAAHMAIGVLFLGGGTYTFGTTNLAIASLICAFYPLFPTDVDDNRVHLQAFRHFWIFAAEARCIVIEDLDIRRPIHMDIRVTLRRDKAGDDEKVLHLRAPCLLPALETISKVQTADPAFWQVTLDFEHNPRQLEAFRKGQRVPVRRCPASEAHASIFSAELAALEAKASPVRPGSSSVLMPILIKQKRADVGRSSDSYQALPIDVRGSSSSMLGSRAADQSDVLKNLEAAVESGNRDALWNLRTLFAWAERQREVGDGKLKWLGEEMIEGLKARVETKMRKLEGEGQF